MKKSTTIILITAGVLVVLGFAMCFVAFIKAGRNWNVFNAGMVNPQDLERKSMDIDEEVTSLELDIVCEDVVFERSADDSFRVEYSDCEELEHTIKVDNGVLKIKQDGEEDRLDITFGINITNEHALKIYVPEGTVFDSVTAHIVTGDLMSDADFDADRSELDLVTGDITFEGSTFTESKINIVTGDVDLTGYKDCESLEIAIVTGDVKIDSYTGKDVDLDIGTGDVSLSSFDAEDLKSVCVTGDFEADLVSEDEYSFELDAATGDISYPESADNASRAIEVSTVTGDIEIS